jgi:hypothetical protein
MTAAAPAAASVAPLRQSAPPLTEAHLRQLAEAANRARAIRRAAAVARFDGWTVGAFAALTLLFSVGSVSGMLVGAAMAAAAAVELRTAERLRRFDPRAARMLARNQLALAATLILYALFQTHAELTGAGSFAAVTGADPQLAQMLRPVEGLARLVALATYGALIAVALLAQGGLALYYRRCSRRVIDYLAHTPPWVVAVQRADASHG